MGAMTWGEAAGVMAAVSFMWHVAMYVGVIINKIKRLEDVTDNHTQAIRELRSGER